MISDETKKQPSLGEEFLMDFFDSLGIKYDREVKIDKLNGDHKQYRIADFYLETYDVYIEFLGSWADPVRREEYNKKKRIYEQNNISCVYIYPDNLGVIKFIFDKQLQLELKKKKDKIYLNRYYFFKFKKSPDLKPLVIFTLLILVYIPYKLHSLPRIHFVDLIFSSILFGIAIYLGSQLYQLYLDIFKRNKYTLENFD